MYKNRPTYSLRLSERRGIGKGKSDRREKGGGVCIGLYEQRKLIFLLIFVSHVGTVLIFVI